MLEKLKLRLPDAENVPDELLLGLLEDAGRAICACTRRDLVPDALEGVQLQLAAIYFNRMGMEGEKAHSEGGVSRTAQGMPEDIAMQLRPWRLAKAVGR